MKLLLQSTIKFAQLRKKAFKIHRAQEDILTQALPIPQQGKMKFLIWLIARLKIARDINSFSVVKEIKAADLVIYTGGGIIKGEALKENCTPIINTHLGLLPAVRGMNAVEWSILLNEPIASTVHLIKAGIDTGPVLSEKKIQIQPVSNLSELRGQALISGLEHLKHTIEGIKSLPIKRSLEQENSNEKSMQCYSLSATLVDLIEDRLNNDYYSFY